MGLVGVVLRKNVILILLSIEVMLNAVNLSFVSFSRHWGNLQGQLFVFFIMIVEAAEVTVGLAIVIALSRLRTNINANEVRELHW